MTEHGWLSPLPPEGASVIRYGTVDRAAEMVTSQGVRALDLLAGGEVLAVVPEHDDDSARTSPARSPRRSLSTCAPEVC